MPGLRKVFNTHISHTDEEAKQWMSANPSLNFLSMYPCADGIKIWYWEFQEVTEVKTEGL